MFKMNSTVSCKPNRIKVELLKRRDLDYLEILCTLLPTSGLRRPVAAAQYCVSWQIPGQQL